MRDTPRSDKQKSHKKVDPIMINLDNRLTAAYKFIRPGSITADIGTDHGYLIAQLVLSGKSPAGYACDINAKPLKRAEKTVHTYGLAGKIRLIQADGITGLENEPIDDFAVLGMGGELIADIILSNPWAQNPKYRFVLNPMTKAEVLRQKLYANGFTIEDEEAVKSGKHIYTIMLVYYTGQKLKIDPFFAFTGHIFNKKDENSCRYMRKVQAYLSNKLKNNNYSLQDNPQNEYMHIINMIEKKCKNNENS